MEVLEIGAGSRKRHGGISLDSNPVTKPDVLHDLNQFPYPFPNDYFSQIYADHVLEHLDDPIAVLTELHRISRPDCIVHIWVPHFRSYWAALDPTHKHTFTLASMDYVTAGHEFQVGYAYTDVAYDLIAAKVNERWPSPGLRGIARWIGDRWPFFYDYRLSHLMPLDEISFRLRVVKDIAL